MVLSSTFSIAIANSVSLLTSPTCGNGQDYKERENQQLLGVVRFALPMWGRNHYRCTYRMLTALFCIIASISALFLLDTSY